MAAVAAVSVSPMINLEYDTVSPLYAEWVESELLPRVEAESRLQLPGQALTLTSDPAGRGTIGCSSGAAAAFTMAWFKPRSFSKVLSYSGSFTNLQYPADPATPDGAAAYAERLVRDAPRKPIRIWMEVGTRDMDWSQWGQHLDWQAANRDLAGALAHKAYDYHFDLAQGAGHCGDARPPDQTLGEAMHWLWQGYPIR
jgi:enterochelin esterase family protein